MSTLEITDLQVSVDTEDGPKQTTAEKAARSSMGSLVKDPYLRFVLIVAWAV